jgi:MFS family permease
MSHLRLTTCVLLPFAAGYYLSYLFRTINALIAGDLATDLGLNAFDLGLLTSVYFLSIAVVQLPLGTLLDRYGPRTIQSLLLLLASIGALVFALAEHFLALLLGRALIGLGVAVALMAGFKAIVLWFPPQRLALANGWLVMLGALGSLTATGPAELIVQGIGWRGLFTVLAALSALAALVVLLAVPQHPSEYSQCGTARSVSLCTIYRDSRFWRIAPLSSVGIATSWSLQGLWAGPWLRDVDGLDRASVVHHLGAMAIAVCVSALLLGMLANWLRRAGIKAEVLLAATLGASMVAQCGLVAQWPLPSLVAWVVIAAAGAATVLSFAILGEYFPKEISARANAALNLLHVGGAFVLQSAAGCIIALWPPLTEGGYPAEAHRAAMAIMLLLQLAAFAWFAVPRRCITSANFRGAYRSMHMSLQWQVQGAARYAAVASRMRHVHYLHRQRAQWRFVAAASTAVCVGLMAAVFTLASAPTGIIHALEVVPISVETIDLGASQQSRSLRAMPPALMRPIGVPIAIPTAVETLR